MHKDPDCIFCKIIEGTIPSYKIYEDDNLVSFMDINPFEKGHVLVVPKHHAATIGELPEEVLVQLAKAVQKIAVRLKERLGCSGLNVLQNNGASAGQTVPHVHVHLIPRYEGKPLRFQSGEYGSDEEMKTFYEKLR